MLCLHQSPLFPFFSCLCCASTIAAFFYQARTLIMLANQPYPSDEHLDQSRRRKSNCTHKESEYMLLVKQKGPKGCKSLYCTCQKRARHGVLLSYLVNIAAKLMLRLFHQKAKVWKGKTRANSCRAIIWDGGGKKSVHNARLLCAVLETKIRRRTCEKVTTS